jgi:hypothetical protein
MILLVGLQTACSVATTVQCWRAAFVGTTVLHEGKKLKTLALYVMNCSNCVTQLSTFHEECQIYCCTTPTQYFLLEGKSFCSVSIYNNANTLRLHIFLKNLWILLLTKSVFLLSNFFLLHTFKCQLPFKYFVSQMRDI